MFKHYCVFVTICVGMLAAGTAAAQALPEGITYGPSRESTGWIEIRGVQSPVDRGIAFDGKVVYLTLMHEVAVVEAKTKKTVWSDSVGAFWDTLQIVNLAEKDQPARWGVELGSTRKPQYRQRYELQTGKKLELAGAPGIPAGKAVAVGKTWSGSGGKQKESLYRLVGSADAWKEVRGKLFTEKVVKLPGEGDVDFEKSVLLVCYAGKVSNWNGISVELAVESEERMLIRLHRSMYQTIGGAREEQPYGVFVLPRREKKEYVLEYNRQNLIGGPAMWKEYMRLKVEK